MVAPSLLEDMLQPFSEWFDDKRLFHRMKNMPSVNIAETDTEYQVAMAVPGLSKDDLHIDIDGNLLSISAEKEETAEDKDKNFTRREYSFTSFSRSFTLPEDVNKDSIDAVYKDGILQVNIPRKDEPGKGLHKKNVLIK